MVRAPPGSRLPVWPGSLPGGVARREESNESDSYRAVSRVSALPIDQPTNPVLPASTAGGSKGRDTNNAAMVPATKYHGSDSHGNPATFRRRMRQEYTAKTWPLTSK